MQCSVNFKNPSRTQEKTKRTGAAECPGGDEVQMRRPREVEMAKLNAVAGPRRQPNSNKGGPRKVEVAK